MQLLHDGSVHAGGRYVLDKRLEDPRDYDERALSTIFHLLVVSETYADPCPDLSLPSTPFLRKTFAKRKKEKEKNFVGSFRNPLDGYWRRVVW